MKTSKIAELTAKAKQARPSEEVKAIGSTFIVRSPSGMVSAKHIAPILTDDTLTDEQKNQRYFEALVVFSIDEVDGQPLDATFDELCELLSEMPDDDRAAIYNAAFKVNGLADPLVDESHTQVSS